MCLPAGARPERAAGGVLPNTPFRQGHHAAPDNPGHAPQPTQVGQDATGRGLAMQPAQQLGGAKKFLKRGEKSNLSLEELSAYFHMPSDQACKQLGIGLTVLKRLCRKYNIKRWPFRKMKSLDRLIDNVKSGNLSSKVNTTVAELEAQKLMLQENKIQDLDTQTRKLQQAFSKHDHRVRQMNRRGVPINSDAGPGTSSDLPARARVGARALVPPEQGGTGERAGANNQREPSFEFQDMRNGGRTHRRTGGGKREAPQGAHSGNEGAVSSGGGFFPNRDDNQSPLTSDRRAMLWIERLLQRSGSAVDEAITELWEIAEGKKDEHLYHILSSDPRLQELKGQVQKSSGPKDTSLRVLPREVTLAAAISDFMTS